MRHLGDFWRLLLVVVISSVILAACGGGGDAATGSGDLPLTPGNSSNSSVPDNPPPLVSPDYDGATGAVDVGQSNAGILALEMMVMVQNSVAFAYGLPESPWSEQTINQTTPGPNGGQVVVQGRGRSDGTGWITIEYQNYQVAANGTSFTYDGTIQVRYDAASADAQSPITVDLAGLTISTAAGSQAFTGTITKTSTTDPDTWKVTTTYVTDLAVFDSTVNASLKAEYRIEYAAPGLTISGKLFDSRIGYVNVASVEPMPFDAFDGSQTPAGGGSIALTGSGDAAMLGALNHYFGSIGMDTDGDGLADNSTRIDWQAFALDTTPTSSGAPEAYAVSSAMVETGKTIKLDGRYSHSPTAHFVHLDWQLVAAPAGSAAELSSQSNPVATFVPDVVGDYLFRLEASGPAGSSVDAWVVQAVSPGSGVISSGDPAAEAGPDRTARVGSKVTLDARGSLSGSGGYGMGTWSWTLYPPPDSQAVLDNVNATRPAFTPDVAGYYSATLQVGGCCTYTQSQVIIDAGGPVHFDPPVDISRQVDASAVAVGDLNDDGLLDLAIGTSGISQSAIVIYGRGNGHFSPPVNTPVGDGVRNVIIQDVNGDSLADLVTLPLYSSGLDYRLQQLDGSLAPVVHIDDASGTSGCSTGFLVVAKLFGASRNSVLTGSCGANAMIYPPVAGGSLGGPTPVNVGTDYSSLAVGDVTGDGVIDLLITAIYPDNELVVSAGQTDGSFAAPVIYSLSQTADHVVVGDLNGDGRNDVALSNNSSIDLLFQQSDGSLLAGRTLAMAGTAGTPVSGDINGDGRTDLIVGEHYYDPVNGTSRYETGLFIQGADGSLSSEYLYPGFIMNEGNKVIADLNGDAVADILTFGLSEFKIMYGRPLGTGQVQTLRKQALAHPAKELPALGQKTRGAGLPLPGI